MEFYQNICRFCSKSVWRKDDKYQVCKCICHIVKEIIHITSTAWSLYALNFKGYRCDLDFWRRTNGRKCFKNVSWTFRRESQCVSVISLSPSSLKFYGFAWNTNRSWSCALGCKEPRMSKTVAKCGNPSVVCLNSNDTSCIDIFGILCISTINAASTRYCNATHMVVPQPLCINFSGATF